MAKKISDPSEAFVTVLMSLYLSDEVTLGSGARAATTLPPMEALVLGVMCLTKTYNSKKLHSLFRMKYQSFETRECGILTEGGILNLIELGYLKPASKAAERLMSERDMEVWGLGDVPFIVTAKGARRIGDLVANLTKEAFRDVVKRLQQESKEAAKEWAAARKKA